MESRGATGWPGRWCAAVETWFGWLCDDEGCSRVLTCQERRDAMIRFLLGLYLGAVGALYAVYAGLIVVGR